eukprot:3583775-Prymnesium_polylepis.1
MRQRTPDKSPRRGAALAGSSMTSTSVHEHGLRAQHRLRRAQPSCALWRVHYAPTACAPRHKPALSTSRRRSATAAACRSPVPMHGASS